MLGGVANPEALRLLEKIFRLPVDPDEDLKMLLMLSRRGDRGEDPGGAEGEEPRGVEGYGKMDLGLICTGADRGGGASGATPPLAGLGERSHRSPLMLILRLLLLFGFLLHFSLPASVPGLHMSSLPL